MHSTLSHLYLSDPGELELFKQVVQVQSRVVCFPNRLSPVDYIVLILMECVGFLSLVSGSPWMNCPYGNKETLSNCSPFMLHSQVVWIWPLKDPQKQR